MATRSELEREKRELDDRKELLELQSQNDDQQKSYRIKDLPEDAIAELKKGPKAPSRPELDHLMKVNTMLSKIDELLTRDVDKTTRILIVLSAIVGLLIGYAIFGV